MVDVGADAADQRLAANLMAVTPRRVARQPVTLIRTPSEGAGTSKTAV